jgi:pimeloyl-ACP methyl ester carboxylesterase
MSLKGGVESAAERFMIGLIGYRRWEALPERTKQARRQEGLALTSELRELRLQAPWNPDNIHAKVLCGCGSEGRQHHQEGAKWLSEHLPNAELVTINGAGHSAPTTHPREFAQQLVEPHLKPSI